MAISKFLIIILWLTLFAGCTTATVPANQSVTELANKTYFTFRPSVVHFDHKYTRLDGSISYTNYIAPKVKLEAKDLLLEIYNTSVDCSPSLSGTSQTKPLSNTNGYWGKVDLLDVIPDEISAPLPSPLCSPPIPQSLSDRLYLPCNEKENCINKERQYEVAHGMYSAYAFCSQKDGKTVLICISQATDNPQMAKDIFSTFKWLK